MDFKFNHVSEDPILGSWQGLLPSKTEGVKTGRVVHFDGGEVGGTDGTLTHDEVERKRNYGKVYRLRKKEERMKRAQSS